MNLMYLRLQYPQAEIFFERIKREREPAAIEQAFAEALSQNPKAQRDLKLETEVLWEILFQQKNYEAWQHQALKPITVCAFSFNI